MTQFDPESRDLVEISAADWRTGDWPHFTHAELACRHTGVCCVTPALMSRLTELRTMLGQPMPINSGYRSPDHPIEARKIAQGRKPGVHTLGMAVDVAANGELAHMLIRLGANLGFPRIGISQRPGPARYVHLDIAELADGFPAPRVWSY